MKQILTELRETLAEFAEQPDWPMLIISGGPMEGSVVLTSLEAVEAQNRREDLFLRFADPIDTAENWTIRAFTSLKLDVERSNRAPEVAGGAEAPMAPLPTHLFDVRRPLAERWRLAFDYLGQLVPDTHRHRIVVAALPAVVEAMPEYAKLVGALVSASHAPDVRHVRVIVRDEQAALTPHLTQLGARVLSYDLALSAAAFVDSLAEDVGDPEVDGPSRMRGLLQLAFLDYAHKRYEPALQKFGRLCAYFTITKEPAMHAVALYGAAQCMDSAAQDLRQIRDRYQQAIALGLEAQSWPLVLEVLIAIVPVCLRLNAHEDARSYSDSAAKLAKGLIHEPRMVAALVLRGDAEFLLNRPRDAVATWTEAAQLAARAKDAASRRAPLERLAHVYRTARMTTELAAVQAELRSLEGAS